MNNTETIIHNDVIRNSNGQLNSRQLEVAKQVTATAWQGQTTIGEAVRIGIAVAKNQ